MPWEDDLGKGEQEQQKPEPENPTPDNPTPDNPTPDQPGGVAVGAPLTPWSEGELDIHTISTGRGECLFFIMPDGTTMVVDAGEFSRVTSEYANVFEPLV